MVKQWCRARKLPTAMLEVLPPHGVIVPDVAVAFLYQTDSPIAFVDGFMSNPEANIAARSLALDEIAIELERLARLLGFRHLWGFALRPETVTLAARHGWDVDDDPYTFVGKQLR